MAEELEIVEIGRDGVVVVPKRYLNTFLDFRLPLVERLEKLALLIGSDEWSSDQAPDAESLIREAALRLSGLMVEATSRKGVFDALTEWNNKLREENDRLKKERDEALFAAQMRWE